MASRIIAMMQLFVTGTWLVLGPGRHSWLTAALALYSVGFAVRAVTFDTPFFSSVARARVILGFRVMCVAYLGAAGCVLIGAFTSLPTAFAWIITPFLMVWISLWIWSLRRSGDSRLMWGPPSEIGLTRDPSRSNPTHD
jgi:hypothetical protein